MDMTDMNAASATTPPGRRQGEVILDLQNISLRFGGVKALTDISFNVREHEIRSIIGPNGAGKSSMLQLLTGLFDADAGELRVCGEDMRRAPVRALGRIGVVFQQMTLDLDLSVEANLVFHARLHGLGGGESRARIADALARVGLAERRADRVRELSGGNRRKVELARALVHRPAVLLMDEATVGLDPASRRHLLAEVLALRAGGVGVLWATHLVDEAEAADRVLVLDKGEMRAAGSPAALVAAAGCESLAAAFLKLTGGDLMVDGT